MPDLHKNFAYSTVLTAPSPATSGASLTVQSGDGTRFPTPPFNATVWPTSQMPLPTQAEIVRVTAIVGDVFTITRTQESTSARAIVAGDQIAATITAKTLTDIEQESIPTCRVFNSGAFSVPNNASTAITFDSERFDTYGMHSTSSNTSRITIPTGWGGVYRIGANVAYVANATGERDLVIRVNGAGGNPIVGDIRPTVGSGLIHVAIVNTDYFLNAGDYVEAYAYQNSGGALNINATGNYTPEFWVSYVSST